MNKLQASMRDRAAKGWRERTVYYKVGSYFKGCANCGITEEDENGKLRFLTGTEVYRSYKPKDVGWTYKCWSCGATDSRCWADAIDIGREPILGNRDVVRKKKYELRKAYEAEHGVANKRSERSATPSPKQDEIDRLQSELDRVMDMLKGVK